MRAAKKYQQNVNERRDHVEHYYCYDVRQCVCVCRNTKRIKFYDFMTHSQRRTAFAYSHTFRHECDRRFREHVLTVACQTNKYMKWTWGSVELDLQQTVRSARFGSTHLVSNYSVFRSIFDFMLAQNDEICHHLKILAFFFLSIHNEQ